MEVIGQRVMFEESGTKYICTALTDSENENVNF